MSTVTTQEEARVKRSRIASAIKLNSAEAAALRQMEEFATTHGQWTAKLFESYSDTVAVSIMNLHNHLLNKHNGFGSAVRPPLAAIRQDEECCGALTREAQCGLAVLIPFNDLLKQFPKAGSKFSLLD